MSEIIGNAHSDKGLLALVKVLIRGFSFLVSILEAFHKEQKGA